MASVTAADGTPLKASVGEEGEALTPSTVAASETSPEAPGISTDPNASAELAAAPSNVSYVQGADGNWLYAYKVDTVSYVYDLNWAPQYAFDDAGNYYVYDAAGNLQLWDANAAAAHQAAATDVVDPAQAVAVDPAQAVVVQEASESPAPAAASVSLPDEGMTGEVSSEVDIPLTAATVGETDPLAFAEIPVVATRGVDTSVGGHSDGVTEASIAAVGSASEKIAATTDAVMEISTATTETEGVGGSDYATTATATTTEAAAGTVDIQDAEIAPPLTAADKGKVAETADDSSARGSGSTCDDGAGGREASAVEVVVERSMQSPRDGQKSGNADDETTVGEHHAAGEHSGAAVTTEDASAAAPGGTYESAVSEQTLESGKGAAEAEAAPAVSTSEEPAIVDDKARPLDLPSPARNGAAEGKSSTVPQEDAEQGQAGLVEGAENVKPAARANLMVPKLNVQAVPVSAGDGKDRAMVKATPRTMASYFSDLLDSFNVSDASLVMSGVELLEALLTDVDLETMHVWKLRPNGTPIVGRSRRIFEGLMSGSMELKATGDSDIASAAGQLQHLNYVQLLKIKWQHRKSAWTRNPRNTHKTFAEKVDSFFYNSLVLRMFTAGSGDSAAASCERSPGSTFSPTKSPGGATGSSRSERDQLAAPNEFALEAQELEFVGQQTLKMLGCLTALKAEDAKSELIVANEELMGNRILLKDKGESEEEDENESSQEEEKEQEIKLPKPAPSWWYTMSCAPGAGQKAKSRPVYVKLPAVSATFSVPNGCSIYRMAMARQVQSYGTWNVVAWRP